MRSMINPDRSTLTASSMALALAVAGVARASVIYSANLISPVDTLSTLPTYTSSTTKQETSTFNGGNNAGQVIGTTSIYNKTSTSVATTAWIFDPTIGNTGTTTFVGLSGGVYTSSGGQQSSSGRTVNASGEAIGASTAYSGNTNLGTDAWFYNPAAVGTKTSVINITTINSYAAYSTTNSTTYNFTGSTGAISSRAALVLNDSGIVGGTAGIFNSTTNFNSGTIGWAYNATTGSLRQIGLTTQATGLSGGKPLVNTAVAAINSAGVIIGNSTRYIATTATANEGQDAWYFDSADSSPTTFALGLTGTADTANYSNVTYSTALQSVSYAGQGFVYSYSNGTGVTQFSQALSINANGLILGTSTRYLSAVGYGNDVWVYNKPANTYTVVGLDGPNYDKGNSFRQNFASAINDSGMVLGTTNRQNTAGTSLGSDTWLYKSSDGSTTTLLPPVPNNYAAGNQFYTNPNVTSATFRSIGGSRLNALGMVAGTVQRYTSTGSPVGQDAWVYDPSGNSGSGQYYIIAPVDPSTFNAASATVSYLSDSGVALGFYYKNNSGVRSSVFYAFVWTEATGAVDLGLEVPNLSTYNWSALENSLYITGDGTIYGSGLRLTNAAGTAPFTTSTEIFAAVLVPEPASITLLAICGAGLLATRRKRGL